MAVDGKPLAGTVSMLTSKFKRLGSPQQKSASPQLAAAIEIVIEKTKAFNDQNLLELASLLNEAISSDCIDQFSSIGERMQKLSSKVNPLLSNQASALTETIPAFTWKLLPSGVKPKDHVKGCQESTQYFLNRILTLAKKNGETTEWPSAFYSLYDIILKEISEESDASGISTTQSTASPKKQAPKCVANSNAAPKVELKGNRWFIEKGKNCDDPVLIKSESIGQGVVVEDCESIKIKIQGKVTLVSINKCKKLTIEIDDIVSNVEVMSSQRLNLFLLGKVPSVILDSSEGIKLLVNENSRDAQILTSKCAEINLSIRKSLISAALPEDSEEDLAEIAIPFQFKTILNPDGSLVTEPVKHAGA